MPKPQTRLHLYRIAVAIIGVMVVLGYLTDVVANEVLFLIAAVLGVGEGVMASLNVDTGTKE